VHHEPSNRELSTHTGDDVLIAPKLDHISASSKICKDLVEFRARSAFDAEFPREVFEGSSPVRQPGNVFENGLFGERTC
jgi:hypothetical protein